MTKGFPILVIAAVLLSCQKKAPSLTFGEALSKSGEYAKIQE